MAEQFKPGDIVRLKSGGPDMTVSAIGSGVFAGEIHCEWFSGKKHEHCWFTPAALVSVERQAAEGSE